MTRQPPGTRAAALSLLLAIAASVFWLFAPTVASVQGGASSTKVPRPAGFTAKSVTESTTGDGRVTIRETGVDAYGRNRVYEYDRPAPRVHRRTLLEDSGTDPRTIAALFLPAVLAGLALALNRTRFRTSVRTVVAALLLVGSILTGFSVGLAYLPSAASMLAAACVSGGSQKGVGDRFEHPKSGSA